MCNIFELGVLNVYMDIDVVDADTEHWLKESLAKGKLAHGGVQSASRQPQPRAASDLSDAPLSIRRGGAAAPL